MPKVTLQPQGAAAALALEIEWEGESDGLRGFTVRWENHSLSGRGALGPNGEGLLQLGSRVMPFYAARTEGAARESPLLYLWLDGEIYVFEVPPAAQAGRARAQAAAASGEVVSPMPGVILKVLARPGEEVAAQAPLVILESMKMELTIPAPAEGRVAEVLCEPGTRVDRGAVLMRLEVAEQS